MIWFLKQRKEAMYAISLHKQGAPVDDHFCSCCEKKTPQNLTHRSTNRMSYYKWEIDSEMLVSALFHVVLFVMVWLNDYNLKCHNSRPNVTHLSSIHFKQEQHQIMCDFSSGSFVNWNVPYIEFFHTFICAHGVQKRNNIFLQFRLSQWYRLQMLH